MVFWPSFRRRKRGGLGMATEAALQVFESLTPCEQAGEMVSEARLHANRMRLYFRWVVAAAAIAIVIAIGLFIAGKNGAGIATGVSGVVSSGAAVFIKNAAEDATTASQKALRIQQKVCGAT